MPTATTSDQEDEQQQRERRDEDAVGDPLAGLTESGRLALLIRFGAAGSKGGMCAAMTHGHSFQSSIFRLPAKCSACHELVWGPFTRGCTCLTCSVTVHRSCTGMTTIPQCPTKDAFDAFCRSELGLPPLLARPTTTSADGCQNGAKTAGATPPTERDSGEVAGAGASTAAATAATAGATAGGDLEEWAKVEETSGHSTSAAAVEVVSSHQQHPPASASCAVQDLGSSFSWSPLGLGERKRPISEGTCEQQQQQGEEHELAIARGKIGDTETETAGGVVDDDAVLPSPATTAPQKASEAAPTTVTTTDLVVAAEAAAATTTSNNSNTMGIRGVTKMSVAGGVVGAIFGGPVGAVVGLKLGAVLGAGRSVQQGLWQRIEKNRREAGAEGIRLPKGTDGAAAAAAAAGVAEEETTRKSRDVWAHIAQQIEGEQQPVIWELDPEQGKLLEQGECDAGEVAMFVVGKVLADETAMLFHLYVALLAEFRTRHRLCDCSLRSCPVAIRRRSSDTDMVALFPRSSSRRGATSAATTAATTDDNDSNNNNRLDSSRAHHGGFFASTPGLEKTFSFVEETEIVAGEGSDTAGVDDDGDGDRDGDSSVYGDSSEGRAGQWDNAERSGVATLVSTSISPTMAAAAAAAAVVPTVAKKRAAPVPLDSWRSNSSRLDSWVQLDDGGCSSCGGRVASGNSQSSRSTRPIARGVEEDEGGLGEGWAAAEAPLCWCRDEGGLSASSEDVQNSMLANVSAERDAATGYHDEGIVPAPSAKVGTDRCDQNDSHQPQNGRCTTGAGATAGRVPDDGEERGGGVEEACDALRDVHGVLRELTRAVLEWCPLLTASHDAQIQAVNCIDQRVFSETYGPVFGRIASSRTVHEGDRSLARRVRREERSRAAGGQPSLLSTCRTEVMSALRAAGSARTGRDKLEFLVQAVERASDALTEQPTTDALIFSVCRHLAAATATSAVAVDVGGARLVVAGGDAAGDGGGGGGGGGGSGGHAQPALPRPHAEVAFVEQFMRDESWVMGKQGYVLTTVIAALHVLSDPDMSHDVFLDAPATTGSKLR